MNHISVKIRQIISSDGNPGSELLFTVGKKHYLTRLPYVVDDVPFARQNEIEQFKYRQGRPLP